MSPGTIYISIGCIIIAAGLLIGSLMVHHGSKINQEISEKKVIDHGKKAKNEIISEIAEQKNILGEAKKDRQEKHDELSLKIDQKRSNTYFPLSSDLRSKIQKNLTSFVEKYSTNVRIIVEIESGNNNRHKVASDLGSLLTVNNLGHYPSGNTYMGRFPDHAITAFCSPTNVDFVNDFITAIAPYFNGEMFINTNFTSQDFIKIYINGDPVFYNSGKVEIQ